MVRRRCLLVAALLPTASRSASLADVLERPAAPVRLASKPAMVRIVRAGEQGTRLVAVGERGIMLLSDDDGRQWRQARVPVSASLTGVQFIDAKRGWAIGHSAVILTTGDGGATWVRQYDGRGLPDGPANPLLDLHFIDERRGWAVGAYGLALHTRDGGSTWQSIGAALPNPKGLHLYAIARHGDTLFMAGEQGLFLSMAVDGRNDSAAALTTPYRGSFFALAALPEGALLFGGLRGTLLVRGAAGEFRTLDSGTPSAIVSVSALPQQRHALVDQSGRVWLGSTAAGRFAAEPLEAERRWVSIAMARDGALVGACNTGVGRLGPPSS
jgi:photosystem II stability/assembly factor-like uncharacterized protein